MTKSMVTVSKSTQIKIHLMASISMDNETDKANTFGIAVRPTAEIGLEIKCTVMELILGQVAESTMASLLTIYSKAQAP